MSTHNKVLLIGRVGNDVAETLRFVNGSPVVNVRLAVSRGYQDENNRDVCDWVTCQFWDQKAEVLAEHAKKGSQISVEGAFRSESWEKDGIKRSSVYVKAADFRFEGGRPRQRDDQAAQPAQATQAAAQPVVDPSAVRQQGQQLARGAGYPTRAPGRR